MNMNNVRHHIIALATSLCVAWAGSALAAEPERGIINLTTNFGPSGVVASVAGISGASDSIQVTFSEPMNPGTFGMGVNFAKSWTKTWNASNTVLTIGGDNLDFSAVPEPTLIVYLMQTDAQRRDISEPNIFKFHDVNVTGVSSGNGQANVDFNILSANGRGYSVYIAESPDGPFTLYKNVNFNSKGAHIKGLTNGKTYWVSVEYYDDGLVATRTAPVAVTPTKPGKG
jgi:hypothetical protein